MLSKRWERLALRWSGVISLGVTVISLAVAGVWAWYRWNLGGAADWMVNLDVTTEVLPYGGSDDLRLLVVHVKSKNPTLNEVEFKTRDSTFTLAVQRVPPGLKVDSKFASNGPRDDVVPPFDLMADAGDAYVFMPGAEFDDTEAIVVKAKTIVHLTATLARKDSIRGPSDFVSVDRFVVIGDE
jgi:hypothetical protein